MPNTAEAVTNSALSSNEKAVGNFDPYIAKVASSKAAGTSHVF